MCGDADTLDPDPLLDALLAASRARLASPAAIAQRDRERRAAGMLPTPEARYAAGCAIARAADALPVYDGRDPDEILGYDDAGLPT